MTGFILGLVATIFSELLTRPIARLCYSDIIDKVNLDGGRVPASASSNWGTLRISRAITATSSVPSFMLTTFALSAIEPVRDWGNGLSIPVVAAGGIALLIFYGRSGRAKKLHRITLFGISAPSTVLLSVNAGGIIALLLS